MCSGCFGEYEEGDAGGRRLPEDLAMECETANEAFALRSQSVAPERYDEFEILVGSDTIVEIRRIYDRRTGVCNTAPGDAVDAAVRLRQRQNLKHTGDESAKNYQTTPMTRRKREIPHEHWVWWPLLAGMAMLAMTALALWLLAA